MKYPDAIASLAMEIEDVQERMVYGEAGGSKRFRHRPDFCPAGTEYDAAGTGRSAGGE